MKKPKIPPTAPPPKKPTLEDILTAHEQRLAEDKKTLEALQTLPPSDPPR